MFFRLKDGPFYVPDFYHNLIEVESATSSGKPVVYRYNSAEFANFTGRGYIFFGGDQVAVIRQLYSILQQLSEPVRPTRRCNLQVGFVKY